MRKLLILVEGQAEEIFANRLLQPHLFQHNLVVQPKLVTTKRPPGMPHHKGGISTYGKIEGDLRRLLNDASAARVTTIIDFYGLPKDFPGMPPPTGNCYDRVKQLEQEFSRSIADSRFLPYLSLHEFEAMLFASPEKTTEVISKPELLASLQQIKSQFNSPEEIDDGSTTAPSKRILKLHPQYRKTADGIAILERIGIDQIRRQCLHFNEWIERLEMIGADVPQP